MKELFFEMFKGLLLGMCFVLFCFVIASLSRSVYSKTVHPHGELALVGYDSNGVQSAYRAFFVRYFSMRSHVMVKLERDTFECVGIRLNLSTNPFQLCHLNYLVVIGKAPLKNSGAHYHA